ncbi:hypothetical protein PpBr36_04069 [Pyricularia pennisetigena]|uniref:hypothetical protein n=1 Tax=Pyricularia pennisetigena TaxID=1578925 RepID=UPI001150B4E5|nr:hypothetical protein PpBr36_04069 [Pyricularia pennisetigena]TLS27153.1 hypothetical protein PpBr36_04069 [Pyricularia pennisetigena]
MARASDNEAVGRLSQEVSSATDIEETAEKTTINLNLQKVPTTTGGEEAVLGPQPDELPNGGLRAWLQVLGGFLLFFNSWAIVNSFGVYQSYYSQNLLSSQSPSNISWIGSIQGFLLLAVGCIAGPLFDAGYFRIVITMGAFLVVVGFMMTSLGTEYWHMLLGQGFCIGMGAGCLVVPSLALLPQYFGPSKRALVIGIAVTGSSLGGVVYPLLFTALLSRIGFGWTNRVLGFISLGTLGTAVIVMRTRVKPRQVRSLFDPASFHETPYLLYCAALFCSNFGFFVPVFYLQQYALSHGLEHSEGLARNLVAVLNGASILGRLAPSLVVPYIGPINTMIWVAGMAALVTFCWVAVNDLAGNVLFAILYGFSTGGIVSLPAVVLASVTKDLGFLGARMGTSNLINAVGSLCGPPLAGAILKSGQGSNWLGLQLFAAFTLTCTALLFYAMRVARVGPRLLRKA